MKQTKLDVFTKQRHICTSRLFWKTKITIYSVVQLLQQKAGIKQIELVHYNIFAKHGFQNVPWL